MQQTSGLTTSRRMATMLSYLSRPRTHTLPIRPWPALTCPLAFLFLWKRGGYTQPLASTKQRNEKRKRRTTRFPPPPKSIPRRTICFSGDTDNMEEPEENGRGNEQNKNANMRGIEHNQFNSVLQRIGILAKWALHD